MTGILFRRTCSQHVRHVPEVNAPTWYGGRREEQSRLVHALGTKSQKPASQQEGI
jgi:hypothetical protein